MPMESINPANGERQHAVDYWNTAQLHAALDETVRAARHWRATGLDQRAELLRTVAATLRAEAEALARLITLEMGKLQREAHAEIEKCAHGCEVLADLGLQALGDEHIPTEARWSGIVHQPLGTVLAIMPWNFPFWQAFRAAAPALLAGNTVLLKHASNVPRCAQAIEDVFARAGLARGVFRQLPISGTQAETLLGDARVHAVSFTGSETAGRRVAAAAGAGLKKSVLELGGSDAFVVLDDADLNLASTAGARARMQNCGQSCIAAKRFVLLDAIADEFIERLREHLRTFIPGDPMQQTTTLAPLARADLRETLRKQVADTVHAGARLVLDGGPIAGPGFYYQPVILDRVDPGMRAYDEELFGPVAIVLRARDESEALRLANDNRHGLGGSVWTGDTERGERFARRLDCGSAFVNAMVKSDPRLPFGGINDSGYGRELGIAGMREFVNLKTVWVQ